jgi:hypothetical protein
MHDCLIVVSNKDDLDWTRLQRVTGEDRTLYLDFTMDGCLCEPGKLEDAILIHFPEHKGDDKIAQKCSELISDLGKTNILAAIHKTPVDGGRLVETEALLRERCSQTILFSHERNDPFWPAYEQVLNCLEHKNSIEQALQGLIQYLGEREAIRQADALAAQRILDAFKG